MKEFICKIELGEDEERIDKWISGTLDSLSRSHIQKLIKEELVFVNDRPQKASYRIKAGDEIRFCIPDAAQPSIPAEDIPLSILYEDDDILIVDKPKGMVVHPAPGHYSGTLVNAVMFHCRDNLSGINGVLRPGIVHRIDKDTTGALIICKNDETHNAIAALLKTHSITRRYRAVVFGSLKQDNGTIDAPIGRHPNDRKKMAVNEKNGKRAVTHYTVLEHMGKYTYIECQLETGRTHQIRVHMCHIGHPLIGDFLYNPKDSRMKRQALHAGNLNFIHPITGQTLTLLAPLPEDMLQFFQMVIS